MLVALKVRAAKDGRSLAELVRRAVEATYGIVSEEDVPRRYSEIIGHLTERLTQKYHPEKIILYGSGARGEFREGSDIDMLIVKRTKAKTLGDRWEEVIPIVRDLTGNISFEPLVYTPEELEERLKAHDVFLQSILESGRVLYDRSATKG
jgi:predicted nucleotidyltransferase